MDIINLSKAEAEKILNLLFRAEFQVPDSHPSVVDYRAATGLLEDKLDQLEGGN